MHNFPDDTREGTSGYEKLRQVLIEHHFLDYLFIHGEPKGKTHDAFLKNVLIGIMRENKPPLIMRLNVHSRWMGMIIFLYICNFMQKK